MTFSAPSVEAVPVRVGTGSAVGRDEWQAHLQAGHGWVILAQPFLADFRARAIGVSSSSNESR